MDILFVSLASLCFISIQFAWAKDRFAGFAAETFFGVLRDCCRCTPLTEIICVGYTHAWIRQLMHVDWLLPWPTV